MPEPAPPLGPHAASPTRHVLLRGHGHRRARLSCARRPARGGRVRDRRRLYRRLDCAESGGARLLRGGARSGAHWLGGFGPQRRTDLLRLFAEHAEDRRLGRHRGRQAPLGHGRGGQGHHPRSGGTPRHSLRPQAWLSARRRQAAGPGRIEGRARSAARASRLQRGASGEPRRHPVARGDRHLSRRHVRRRRRAPAPAQLQSRARAGGDRGRREDFRRLARRAYRFRQHPDGSHGNRLRQRALPRAVRQCLYGRSGAGHSPQDHAGQHLHRHHADVGRQSRPGADPRRAAISDTKFVLDYAPDRRPPPLHSGPRRTRPCRPPTSRWRCGARCSRSTRT